MTKPKTIDAYTLLHRGLLALARAEQSGIRIDVDYVKRKKEFLSRKIERLEKQFQDTNFYRHWQHVAKDGKVNINSNPQLAHFLYHTKKLTPPYMTDSGTQGATDEEALKQLNLPELNLILEMRKLRKVRDTYLDAFAREQVNGYIHPFFNLHLVQTYRSSSDSPNFQNIPARDEESMQMCRRAIYPRPGHQLVEIDYSGIEFRIATCYGNDPVMIDYCHNPDSDIHGDMAKQIFIIDNFDKSVSEYKTLRKAAKNGFVFPELYGSYYANCAMYLACDWGNLTQDRWHAGEGIPMPNGSLADHLKTKGIGSFKSFTAHMQKVETAFWNKFAQYARWKEDWWHKYQRNGYIDSLTGFTCRGVMDRKQIFNYPIQGAAFHCLLWSFIELDRIMNLERWDTRLVGQIHDSIILDVNPSELDNVLRIAHRVTCNDLPNAWKWIIVPLEVEIEVSPIDGSWADKRKVVVN